MPGGKGKSIGGKGGSKDSAGKTQKSHSAKAGLQVSTVFFFVSFGSLVACLLIPVVWVSFCLFGGGFGGGPMSGGRVGMERRVDFPPCRYRTGSVAMDVAFFFCVRIYCRV